MTEWYSGFGVTLNRFSAKIIIGTNTTPQFIFHGTNEYQPMADLGRSSRGIRSFFPRPKLAKVMLNLNLKVF